MKKINSFLIVIACLFSASTTFAQTELNTLGSYKWNIADLPRTFNGKLQFSFVRAEDGFPQYGSVLAGGAYTNVQDGSAFQIYFPYSSSMGGKVPRIRLGQYNNQGWSDWQSFYTSANANNIDTDWTARKIYVVDKIGIGVQNPTEKLAVNGKIRATEIKVDSGPWPDFVFEEDYKLTPLKDVETFIKENKHLPGVPKAKEIEENGLSLGEMVRILMQKNEELTLHLIEKDKEIEDQNSRIQKLETLVNKLVK
ncbi:hypothetical protein [Sphingobacterium anhuiense]|uniref:Uncharacterized protein n=1 Tax=Sphingobacterium anhuiense TaxID=493780 RepID=A0ABW5YVH5_9SPHI